MGSYSPLVHPRSARVPIRRRTVRVALLGLLASVSVVIIASTPSSAKQAARDAVADQRMATCRTDDDGTCAVRHSLGVVPVGLLVAPRISRYHEPYALSVIAGSETIETFRVLAVRADGRPNANKRIRFIYRATGEPDIRETTSPAPTTTSTTSTTAPTMTTTTASTTERTPTSTATSSPPATTASPTPGQTTAEVCADPLYSWSGNDFGGSVNGSGYGDDKDYYGMPNVWNDNGGITESMGVCSFHSWYVDVTAAGTGDGAVLSYPNMHKDWHDWGTGAEPQVDAFTTIPTHFAHTAQGVGVYNVAYDIWIDGVATPGCTELMIWTENRGQRPAGDLSETVTVGGRQWELWTYDESGLNVVTYLATEQMTSGSLDLKHFTDHLASIGRIRADATLGQVGYGVEIVSTDSKRARFDFTDFQVDAY